MKKIIKYLVLVFLILILFSMNNKTKAEEFDFEIDREVRAVWVSPLVGDISRFSSESQYKSSINSVLNKMEKYNLNTIYFHVRIYNDALYESNYNKWSSFYSTSPSWDMLPWMIDECHKRGIEFIAWMNPYRVSTSTNKESVAKNFLSINPASNPSNLLTGSCTILNPGIPEVQSFLISTCMELVNKYDIDGIHFDDYFYISGMESDFDTYTKYGEGEGIEQFRRNSIDKFISGLHKRLERLFKEEGRAVSLGISPTPVWANGDGVVSYDDDNNIITTGSNTKNAQGHYGAYLYCDTLKWVNNGWIDYIIPQCYIGTSGGNENYFREVEWWSKVCERKPCQVVVGIGLYRAGGNDWLSNTELKTELDFLDSISGISGFALYSFRHLDENNDAKNANLVNAKSHFEGKTIPYILDSYKKDVAFPFAFLEKKDDSSVIHIIKNSNVKYYIILKEEDDIVTLFDITNSHDSDCVYVIDSYKNNVSYYIGCIDKGGNISKYTKISSDDYYLEFTFLDQNDNVISKRCFQESSIDFPEVSIPGAKDVTWERTGNTFKLHVEMNKYKVTYLVDGIVFKEIEVGYLSKFEDIECNIEGFIFEKWDYSGDVITSDLTINAIGKWQEFTISYYIDERLVYTEKYPYGTILNLSYVYNKNGYKFLNYTINDETAEEIIIKQDYIVHLNYEKILKVFHLNYDLDGGCFTTDVTYEFDEDHLPGVPSAEKEGYKFLGWMENGKYIRYIGYRDYNLTAVYEKIEDEKEVSSSGCNKESALFAISNVFSLLIFFGLRRRKYE